jgi:nucleotide-binding universal stress UspA family protein
MYKHILITLDATPTDRAIIDHVKELAKTMNSDVVLLHVATGVPAQFNGPDAAGEEIDEDKAYLDNVQAEFTAAGIPATQELRYGDPFSEIVKWVERHHCDLIAMSTHGHRFLGDLLHGATASRVQHHVTMPVLLIRAH